MFENFVDTISEVPSTFLQNVIDMSKTLQLKLREYSEATTGKMNPNFVSIASVHEKLITKVRSNDKLYQTLLSIAKNYSNLDIDEQPQILDDVYKLLISEVSKVEQAKK